MHIPCSRTNAKKPKKKIDATHLKDMCNEGKSLGFQLIDCKTQSCQSPKRGITFSKLRTKRKPISEKLKLQS